jgi:uncharacterized membrane protein
MLLKVDKKSARLLIAGIAVLAGAALITTYKVDIQTLMLMGFYLVILGVVLVVAANAVNDPAQAKVLGWFVTLLIIAVVSVMFVSAVFRQQGVLKPTYCLVRFWERCADAEAAVVTRNAPEIREEVRQAPKEEVATAGAASPTHAVFIQFAGLITRESVIQMNQTLRGAGWKVQDPRGERIPDAQGLNEVRYARPEDRPAAEALAQAITASAITSTAVEARQFDVGPTTLEAWISN